MKKVIYIISGLLILLYACEDVIDFDVNAGKDDLYVIEGTLDNVDGAKIRISKSMSVTIDGFPLGISDALVTISDEQGNSTDLVYRQDTLVGYYAFAEDADFPVEADNVYKLTVKHDNQTFIATDTLWSVAPIDSIEVFPSLRGDGRFLAVYAFAGQEPPGLGDYYKWDIFVKQQIEHSVDKNGDSIYTYEEEFHKISDQQNIIIASDDLVDGQPIVAFEIFTDFHNPLDTLSAKLFHGDSVFVYQSSVSKGAYYYLYQVLMQAGNGGFLFDVPPANVSGNVKCVDDAEQEVLGYFYTSHISVSDTVIAPDVWKKEY